MSTRSIIAQIVMEERTPDMISDPDDMWMQLVDLCETDGDLEALYVMRDQAEGRGK